MALSTPLDIITLALKTSGAIGVGQTPLDEDTNDSFNVLNLILSEWQINRWLVQDLIDATKTSTGAISYTVGPTGDFVFSGQRPDRVDAAFGRLIATSADSFLYPFMSREGFDRITSKSATGAPESYYYDPGLGTNGTIYFWPVPSSSYSLHVQGKANIGQFTSLTQSITLPQPYVSAMVWNLAAQLRSIYQLPPDPLVDRRAASSLQAIINSIAQVPQAIQAVPSNRQGIYSSMAGNNDAK